MTHVADTSFLVAVFDEKDRRQAEARKAFAAADRVLIPTEILVETLGVLQRKSGDQAARAALEGLVGIPNVRWGETCNFTASSRIFRQERGLSFADAIVVEQCIATGWLPLSFDEDQVKAIRRRQASR
jgi:predicted nucleic acid-binding protein